jgi:hypothetical protein
MSNFLLNRNGVLPIPIFTTEPAIGYGFGLALLHFSLPENPGESQTSSADAKSPRPNITGIAGFATGTHSALQRAASSPATIPATTTSIRLQAPMRNLSRNSPEAGWAARHRRVHGCGRRVR